MSCKVLDRIYRLGFVPVLEDVEPAVAAAVAEAMRTGGVNVVDICFAGKNAASALKEAAACEGMIVGASGVKSVEQCEKALAAGAQFIISEGVDAACVALCCEKEIALIPQCASLADIKSAQSEGLRVVNLVYADYNSDIEEFRKIAASFVDMKFIISLGDQKCEISNCLRAPFAYAVRGTWVTPAVDLENKQYGHITLACEDTITNVFDFEMYHIGINMENAEDACALGDELNDLFRFKLRDNGPSSRFVGTGIEVMKRIYRGKHGHFAIRTNNVDRAIMHLHEKGYEMDMDTAYIADGRIFTVYLKDEHSFGGFAAHLMQKTF